MNNIACIIPAAGLSSRMGDFKPLLVLNNKTMIENTVDSMVNAGVHHCVIILGYRGTEIEHVLKDNPHISFIYNHDYDKTDMLYSLKLGLTVLEAREDISGCFILPADMPMINSNTMQALATHFNKTNASIVFPRYGGRKKHPPLLARQCFRHIIDFKEDGGLKQALKCYENETTFLEVDDLGCCLDADTASDFTILKKYSDHRQI